MRPFAFQLLRELSHERFISGVALAEKYGVSRSAVSDALRDASAAGVDIFSLTRRGYRLAEPVDLLNVDIIRRELGDVANRVNVEVIETIGSTNAELMVRAIAESAAPSGTCLVAEIQTAGRGRRGRSWESAFASSLTFSLLWRFDRGAAQLGGLSLVVGLAIIRTLQKLGLREKPKTPIMLKWPNDVLAGHRKLAGVLIESQGDMLGPTAVVIGIGLNVKLPADIRERVDQPVADLQETTGLAVSRNNLLAALLQELVSMLDAFQQNGFAPFKLEWTAAHALHGKAVRVLHADGRSLEATVNDVADDGSLIVTVAGREINVSSGEISLRGVNK